MADPTISPSVEESATATAHQIFMLRLAKLLEEVRPGALAELGKEFAATVNVSDLPSEMPDVVRRSAMAFPVLVNQHLRELARHAQSTV